MLKKLLRAFFCHVNNNWGRADLRSLLQYLRYDPIPASGLVKVAFSGSARPLRGKDGMTQSVV